MFKVIVLCAFAVAVRANILEPAVRFETPVHALKYEIQPAITKTQFIPGSYSSSYRHDVITPRVKFTETPGLSVSIAQPSVAVAPAVARVEHISPVLAKTEILASPEIHSVARSTLVNQHNLKFVEPLPLVRSFSVAHHL